MYVCHNKLYFSTSSETCGQKIQTFAKSQISLYVTTRSNKYKHTDWPRSLLQFDNWQNN